MAAETVKNSDLTTTDPSELISDNGIPFEIITTLFNENGNDTKALPPKQKKKRKHHQTRDGNVLIICEICGAETTLRDYDEHEKTEIHQSRRKLLKQKKRKERKQRVKKNRKKTISVSEENQIPTKSQLAAADEKTRIREKYQIRPGDPLPEHHQEYIKTLAVFLSLRYSFETDKNFKISLVNAKWHEFGDIVIEIGKTEEITEIQAIQCKQILYRNSILVSFLSAEMGKFSLKTRGEILKKLQKKIDFEKAFFKLYTVSHLIINRHTFSSLLYDNSILEGWKNNAEKESWRGREIQISEHNKLNFFNTTDESDDIYTFKLKNCNDTNLENVLNRFSMFTSQKKTESLILAIKSMLKKKFDKVNDVSDELIKYVYDNFELNTNHMTCFKLTKRDFLLELTNLLLEPYCLFSESTKEKKELKLWNKIIKTFDAIVIKNHPDIIGRVYSGIDYILKQEIRNTPSEDASWPQIHLDLWKEKLVPLILKIDNESDLHFVNKVLDFLKKHSLNVKFIILIENFKINRDMFSRSLDIFLNLVDLKHENDDVLKEVLENVEINFDSDSILLRDIVEYNEDFLEKITPCSLLNMFWKDYSFQMSSSAMTNDILQNTLVIKDSIIKNFSSYFQKDDSDSDSDMDTLSYVISDKGNVIEIHVPPDI